MKRSYVVARIVWMVCGAITALVTVAPASAQSIDPAFRAEAAPAGQAAPATGR